MSYIKPSHEAVYSACKNLLPELAEVIADAVKAERERCAKICLDSVTLNLEYGVLECSLTPDELAKKIREGT
jgi:hypothetical protein